METLVKHLVDRVWKPQPSDLLLLGLKGKIKRQTRLVIEYQFRPTPKCLGGWVEVVKMATRTGQACKFEMQTAHPCHSITHPDDSSSSLDGWQSISSVRQISVCFHWSAPRNRATWLPQFCPICPGSAPSTPSTRVWVSDNSRNEWMIERLMDRWLDWLTD